jgi:hypothetical protein
MADPARIEFQPVQWGPRLEGWLHRIDGIERHINAMADQIDRGAYQALLIDVGGQDVGALVWSVEIEPRGPVVVVNALAADPVPKIDMSAAALAFVAHCGRAAGAVAVRFWTERRGLVRKMQRHGFRKTYVMEGAL